MGRIGENGEESSSPLESPYRLMAIAVLMAALGVYISAPNAPQPAKRFDSSLTENPLLIYKCIHMH